MKRIKMFFLLTTTAFLFSCGNSEKNISYPCITAQGVEPFLIGASLLNIPSQGTFYDTIVIEKEYTVAGEDGACGMTEERYKELIKNGEYCEVLEVQGFANVIKDSNTLFKIEYDGDGVIESINILSNLIKTENGICIGMSVPELVKNYNALFIAVTDVLDPKTSIFDIPFPIMDGVEVSIPSLSQIDIRIDDNLSSEITAKYWDKIESGDNIIKPGVYRDTIPAEMISDCHVNTISIPKIQ